MSRISDRSRIPAHLWRIVVFLVLLLLCIMGTLALCRLTEVIWP